MLILDVEVHDGLVVNVETLRQEPILHHPFHLELCRHLEVRMQLWVDDLSCSGTPTDGGSWQ